MRLAWKREPFLSGGRYYHARTESGAYYEIQKRKDGKTWRVAVHLPWRNNDATDRRLAGTVFTSFAAAKAACGTHAYWIEIEATAMSGNGHSDDSECPVTHRSRT